MTDGSFSVLIVLGVIGLMVVALFWLRVSREVGPKTDSERVEPMPLSNGSAEAEEDKGALDAESEKVPALEDNEGLGDSKDPERIPAMEGAGWFALDERGRLGYFHAGENGAMLANARYIGGYSAEWFKRRDLWETDVIPWMAKNRMNSELAEHGYEHALFETPEQAAKAVECGAYRTQSNPRLVHLEWSLDTADEVQECVINCPGFVGASPIIWETFWNDKAHPDVPVVAYAHFEDPDHNIPGEFTRMAMPLEHEFELPDDVLADIDRMPIDFAEHEEIQIADYYPESDLSVYGGPEKNSARHGWLGDD